MPGSVIRAVRKLAHRLLCAVQQGRQLLEQFPFALLDGAHVAGQLLDALCSPALGLEVERARSRSSCLSLADSSAVSACGSEGWVASGCSTSRASPTSESAEVPVDEQPMLALIV